MADVHDDLVTDAEALAELVLDHEERLLLPTARAVAAELAELTVHARRVVLAVQSGDSSAAPQVTASGLLHDVVQAWLSEHRKATALLAGADGEVRWNGEPLRAPVIAAELLTAVFAHGQDIADLLGVPLIRKDSIGHVAYYGVRTRDAAYYRQGLAAPDVPFRFELRAPSGTEWAFGPADSTERVIGRAEDFCLLVTGRRPAADLYVEAIGAHAREWLELVQLRKAEPDSTAD